MNKLTINKEKPGYYIVDGDLTFSAMDKKTVNSFAFLTGHKEITIDLGGVGNADSAGLALMLEWVKLSRSRKMSLRFRNIPQQLLNLAKLSGIDKLSYFINTNPPAHNPA
jgi:phospholipid transport system transporter-binding protein